MDWGKNDDECSKNCVTDGAKNEDKSDYLEQFQDFIENEAEIFNRVEDNQDDHVRDVIDNEIECFDENVDDNGKKWNSINMSDKEELFVWNSVCVIIWFIIGIKTYVAIIES